MGLPPIDPPILNSASPWCTTIDQLRELLESPHTGAVTTRTSLLSAFHHDPQVHQRTFFAPATLAASSADEGCVPPTYNSSLNTLGYSPHSLAEYITALTTLRTTCSPATCHKPFIVSVTGTPDEIAQCYALLVTNAETLAPLAMEINLSCPNIPSKPPPAYSGPELGRYLAALAGLSAFASPDRTVGVGIKTPPYTYHDQFATLIAALRSAAVDAQAVTNGGPWLPVDFITATNTLGSCLLLDADHAPVLSSASGTGVGGMAGAALHPLALGNVSTLRRLLDAEPLLEGIDIIGVGGVGDSAGYARMRGVGAKVVAVGTALGREGVGVFGSILGGGGSV